jgi:hypothetical protein
MTGLFFSRDGVFHNAASLNISIEAEEIKLGSLIDTRFLFFDRAVIS